MAVFIFGRDVADRATYNRGVRSCLRLSWYLVSFTRAFTISCGCGFDYCDGHLRQMAGRPCAVQQHRP